MSISIEPLSKLPIAAVSEFLGRYKHEPAVIDWKYYDNRFNGNRERGFACIDDHGRIASFLGLIPFTVMHNGNAVDAAWSCDWYRDPKASGPLGIMLIRRSLKAYPLIYSFGGSEMTKAIMGRLSRVTVADAGIELYKPLRIGGAMYGLRKAASLNYFPSLPVIDNVKLPIKGWKSKETLSIRFVASLPVTFTNVLNNRVRDAHVPAYDLAYLQWLLERCPSITGGACIVSHGDESIGAILFWRPVTDRRFWRISLLPEGRNYKMLEAGLPSVIRHTRDNGGWLISLLASRLDKDVLELAGRHGFYRSKSRRPLYILTQDVDAAPHELEQLSYLDTDYASRFPEANS